MLRPWCPTAPAVGSSRCSSTRSDAARSSCPRSARTRGRPPRSAQFGAPARAVPVAAQIGLLPRYDDLVPFAGADLVVAPGAAVGLRGLVRLHMPYFDRVVEAHAAAASAVRWRTTRPAADGAHQGCARLRLTSRTRPTTRAAR